MNRTTQQNILILRNKGYSQALIAEEVGTSQPLICRWESGAIPASAEIAMRLASLADACVYEETQKSA